jgi:hypothetical protein
MTRKNTLNKSSRTQDKDVIILTNEHVYMQNDQKEKENNNSLLTWILQPNHDHNKGDYVGI